MRAEVAFALSVMLHIPDQSEIDAGEEPQVVINAGRHEYRFDVYQMLKEDLGIHPGLPAHEEADALAEWLEHWAARLREEFPAE